MVRERSRRPHQGRTAHGAPSDETPRSRPSDFDRAASAAGARHVQRPHRRRHHARAGAARNDLQAGVLHSARGRRHERRSSAPAIRPTAPTRATRPTTRSASATSSRRTRSGATSSRSRRWPRFPAGWRSIRTASTRSKKAERVSACLLVPARSGHCGRQPHRRRKNAAEPGTARDRRRSLLRNPRRATRRKPCKFATQ